MKIYDLTSPQSRFFAHLEIARALAVLGRSDEYHVSRYLGADPSQVRRVLDTMSEYGSVGKTKTVHDDDTPQQLWQGNYGYKAARGWGEILRKKFKRKSLPEQTSAQKKVISKVAAKRPGIDFGMKAEHSTSFSIMRFSRRDDVYEIAQLAQSLTPEQRDAIKTLMQTIVKKGFTSSSE